MNRVLAHLIFLLILALSLSTFASGIQSRAFSLFLRTLNSHINATLDAESFEYQPPSTFVFQKVILKNRSGIVILVADTLKGTFNLGELFSGNLSFDSIEASSPKIYLDLTQDTNDFLNLFRESPSPTSTDPAPIHFGKISVKNGTVHVKLNEKHSIQLQHLETDLGSFHTPIQDLHFKNIRSKIFSNNLPISTELQGSLDLRLDGTQDETVFTFSGSSKSFSAYNLGFSKSSKFSVNAKVKKDLLTVNKLLVDGPQIKLDLQGTIDFSEDFFNLQFASDVLDSKDISDQLGQNLHLREISLKSSLTGSFARPQITANGSAKWNSLSLAGAIKYDFASEQISGELEATSKEKNLALKPFIAMDAFISEPKAQFSIGGTLKHPTAKGSARCSRVFTNWIKFEKCSSFFDYQKDILTITDAVFQASMGAIKIPTLRLNTTSEEITGRAQIEQFNPFETFSNSLNDSTAIFNASATLAGTLKSPQVTVDGNFRNFRLLGNEIGLVDTIARYGFQNSSVLQISAGHKSIRGNLDLRASYDFRSRQTNTLIDFVNFNIDSIMDTLDPWLKFGTSSLNGTLAIQGPLTEPQAQLSLTLNAESGGPQMNPLGVHLYGTLIKRELSFNACANLYRQVGEDEPCEILVPLHFSGSGVFENFNRFQLNYKGKLKSGNLERVSDFLRRESILLSTNFDFSGKVVLAKGQSLAHEGSGNIFELVADLPDLSPISLAEPLSLVWSKDTFSIEKDARFSLTDGELSIGGGINRDRISAHLMGRIPMLVARMLSREVVEATGLAHGTLDLTGTRKTPLINATLSPDKGSLIKLRSFPTDIEFASGDLTFKVLPESEGRIRADINSLRLNFGNGFALLDGFLHLDFLAESGNFLQESDLSLTGSDISFAVPNFSLDADSFNLRLKGTQGTNAISGDIGIGSGKFVHLFILRNFEFEAVQSKGPDKPLPDFLQNITTDINLEISSLDLLSSLVVFDFTGNASGSLKLEGSLSKPRINGTLELNEGLLDFPVLDLEIPATQVQFKPSSDRAFDPELHFKAMGIIPAGEFGSKQETSVELSLDGNLDKLQLDLKPISGDGLLDRTKLLYILLNPSLGTSSETDLLLLKPLTLELEKLISAYTKTRFRIGASLSGSNIATTFQWRLNPRLELEGSASTNQLGLQEARFKLYLFDHLPVGEKLYLEGRFSFLPVNQDNTQGTQSIKLNYRLFEQ